MDYKLYKEENKFDDITCQILSNRGIQDPEEYLNLDDNCLYDYHLLDNINDAVKCFVEHFDNKDQIAVLVDSDVDGYTSAASMINYIKKLDKNYPVKYIMHKEVKAHGLSDLTTDVIVPEGTKLLIVPDAGTNDFKACSELVKKGIDIIILDHHIVDEDGFKNAKQCIIVNNQMSDRYPNKDLSGVGVVYKFLQALDEEMWNEYADDFLDLVALGNISDVMDVRSYETKRLIEKGLKNINNKAFISLIKAQEFSMNGIVNIHNVQFYITPVINGCIRVGSIQEQEILFRAFIELNEMFEYKKRATKNSPAEVIKETIFERAARLSKNAKSRQDKLRDKAFNEIMKISNDVKDNKVAIFDVSDILENKGLTGVVAVKVADKLNKPCLLVKKYINENGDNTLSGSGRNFDHSPIESLKDTLSNTGLFEYCTGHDNAFGLSFLSDKLDEINEKLNDDLKNIKYDNTYFVDYKLSSSDVDLNLCKEISDMNDLIGQGIDEPLVVIENLLINRSECQMFGKTTNTIKFEEESGINYIQFFCKEGQLLYDWLNESWAEDTGIVVNIIGTPSINEYNGIKTPQVVIKDIEIIEHIFDEDEDMFSDIDEDTAW